MINPYESPAPARADRNRRDPPEANADAAAGSLSAGEIELRGALSLADFLHAHVVMVQRRWYRLVGLVVVYAATIAGLSVVERGYGNLSSSRILFNGLVVVPALMSGSLAWIWYRLSRKADRQVGIFAQTHTVLTDAGLLWPSGSGNEKGVARRGMSAGGASPNHPVTVPWSAFSEVIISDRVALLFLRKSSAFLIVPRAKLVKATDWPVLAAFLQARIQ